MCVVPHSISTRLYWSLSSEGSTVTSRAVPPGWIWTNHLGSARVVTRGPQGSDLDSFRLLEGGRVWTTHHGAAKRGKKLRLGRRGWRILGQMWAHGERPQHGKGEADGSETEGMDPDRLDLGAYPNLHPRPCPIAHAQPASQHSAASTVVRCKHGVGRVGWSGAGTLEPHHLTPSTPRTSCYFAASPCLA